MCDILTHEEGEIPAESSDKNWHGDCIYESNKKIQEELVQ